MKLHLYNYSLPVVFSYCDDVLKKMNFRINYSDFKRGLISASNGEGLSSLSTLLDLKFSSDKYSVGIAIISSSMSNIFGNIYYDPVSEKKFIENLFESLQARKIGLPFIPEESDYIAALST